MKPNGCVLYEGPSLIDGKPIVVILTGLTDKSDNPKTGAMLQTYIIRSDINPVEAVQDGSDFSICGDCKHRPLKAKSNGEARCYVNVGQSVNNVWKAYHRNSYPELSPVALYHAVRKKNVRLGTYGDPAAVPFEVLGNLAKMCKGHTGYTHQWKEPYFDHRYKDLIMASVDSPIEQIEALALNMRYFRVQIGSRTPLTGEINCPASKEGGRKTTCNACQLCSGNKLQAKNIVIADHGIGYKGRALKIA